MRPSTVRQLVGASFEDSAHFAGGDRRVSNPRPYRALLLQGAPFTVHQGIVLADGHLQ
jgi:hypothetical protein